jgi:hypothetical protein
MPNSLDREAFEAWATSEDYSLQRRDTGEYRFVSTANAWLGWQAGAAAEREACAKICESFGGELTKWPDAYEGATAETQFIRGIGDCISKPFAKAIRDRSAP